MLFGENTFRQLFAGHVVGFRPTKRHEKMHRMMRLIVATYVLGTFVSSEPQGLQCNRQWSFIVFSCLDVTFPVTNIIQTQYCFYFQIDNQQIGTVFPVALYPSPLPKAVIQKSGTCRFFAPAGFWPRGQNPRRHYSLPRVYVQECVKYWCSMRINPDLMKLGAHGGPG